MRHASAHDSGTGGCSTAQRAMAAASGTAYSISEMFADGLGNGMALERGHQILRSIGKANKPALVPLLARTVRTIDLAVGERREGPILLRHDAQRLGRLTARHWVRAIGKRAGIELVHPHVPRAARNGRPRAMSSPQYPGQTVSRYRRWCAPLNAGSVDTLLVRVQHWMAKRAAAHKRLRSDSSSRPTRWMSTSFGSGRILSKFATHWWRRPCAGPSGTSVGMSLTRLVTGATRIVVSR